MSQNISENEVDIIAENSAAPLPVAKDPALPEKRPLKRTAKRSAGSFSSDQSTRISEPVKEEKKAEPQKKTPEPQKPKPEAPQKLQTRDRGGITLSMIKALVYIAAVLFIGAWIGITGIKWGNDVFAFVKEEHTATVTIPQLATIDEIADILESQGIISEPAAFKFYYSFKFADKNYTIVPGSYELNSTMNYDQIVYAIREKPAPREIVEVTIPEGYTVDQIIDLLVNEYKIGTREGYVEAINNYAYSYGFMEKLNAIELSKDRKYRLEGYIFPAKYDIYTDLSEVGVIDYFLSAFEKNMDDSYYERMEELGMDLDQVITLASLVQAEGKYDSDYYLISSVFHNRLNSKDHKKMESDATIQYFLPERKEELSASDLALDNPYNTYIYEGLTPGAICNPGLESIHAALYPEETKYLYFVADIDGYSLFSETLAGHNKNKALVAAHKAEAKQEQQS